MFLHAAAARIAHDHRSGEFSSASAAETLICLYRRTAFIAKHDSSRLNRGRSLHQIRTVASVRSNAEHLLDGTVDQTKRALPRVENEKATRQLGGLFFQGRIVLTEIKPSKLSGEIL